LLVEQVCHSASEKTVEPDDTVTKDTIRLASGMYIKHRKNRAKCETGFAAHDMTCSKRQWYYVPQQHLPQMATGIG